MVQCKPRALRGLWDAGLATLALRQGLVSGRVPARVQELELARVASDGGVQDCVTPRKRDVVTGST